MVCVKVYLNRWGQGLSSALERTSKGTSQAACSRITLPLESNKATHPRSLLLIGVHDVSYVP